MFSDVRDVTCGPEGEVKVDAFVTEGTLGRRRVPGNLPYEQQIQQTLDRVLELISFVRGEHFGVELLLQFWRADKRALITAQTIGRLLGRPLSEELTGIKETLERGLVALPI